MSLLRDISRHTGSIVNGFTLPVKKEHKHMLEKALIPLHTAAGNGGHGLDMYHEQLRYCMVQFASKDHRLTVPIILGLLRYWPKGNLNKVVLFLHELEELINFLHIEDLQLLHTPLFTRLGKCVSNAHFQVGEKSLCMWNSPSFMHITVEQPLLRGQTLPLLMPHLLVATRHWQAGVRTLAEDPCAGFDSRVAMCVCVCVFSFFLARSLFFFMILSSSTSTVRRVLPPSARSGA